MTLGFEQNDVIEDTTAMVEILKAALTDTYGPQISLKVKAIGGKHDGHTFMDYSSRDETTGNVKEGTKAWSIFLAALGPHFYEDKEVDEQDLVGKRIMARITKTKSGSRNKLEFGTIGPVRRKKPMEQAPPEPSEVGEVDQDEEDEEDEEDEDDLESAPF